MQQLIQNLNAGAGLRLDWDVLWNYFTELQDQFSGNVFCVDTQGKGLFCNQTMLGFLGFDAPQQYHDFGIMDYVSLNIMTPENANFVKEKVLDVARKKEFQLHIREPAAKSLAGKGLSLMSSRFPIFDERGEVIAIFGSTVEISDDGFFKKEKPVVRGLSPKQLQVLALYNLGYPRQQIAEELSIAESTVAWYLREIRAKFNIRTRKEMLELERGLACK
jgi:DNA-binding CsgD family transcriptional regulator